MPPSCRNSDHTAKGEGSRIGSLAQQLAQLQADQLDAKRAVVQAALRKERQRRLTLIAIRAAKAGKVTNTTIEDL